MKFCLARMMIFLSLINSDFQIVMPMPEKCVFVPDTQSERGYVSISSSKLLQTMEVMPVVETHSAFLLLAFWAQA